MAYYSITYDLIKSKDYAKIREGIKSLSNDIWAKPTLSQWIIQSDKSVVQVRDYLKNYMDNDDILFVIEVKENTWASWNIPKDVSAWLNK